MSAGDILDTIDQALNDWSVSGDAMRWAPEAQAETHHRWPAYLADFARADDDGMRPAHLDHIHEDERGHRHYHYAGRAMDINAGTITGLSLDDRVNAAGSALPDLVLTITPDVSAFQAALREAAGSLSRLIDGLMAHRGVIPRSRRSAIRQDYRRRQLARRRR